jgi:hypothetical protein
MHKFGLLLQESISSVQEAGSSLVPPLAPAVAAAVKDIMIRVLQITSDPDFGELDTSRHSLAGNIQPNLSHHRSLDILPLTNSSTKQFGSTTETVESAEQDNKKLLPRTVSSVVRMINIYIYIYVCVCVCMCASRKCFLNS